MEDTGQRGSRWPWLISLLAPVWTLYPLLMGAMPWSHDHTVHLFKSMQLYEELLPKGHVTGWSNIWFFGYPAGELYSPSIELWVAAIRALTLETLSWEATYGLAFLLAMIVMTLATYRVGAHFISPWVGTIAAVLFALDPGEWMQGGWGFTVDFGVWAQPLSGAFIFLGVVELDRWRRGEGRGAPFLACICLGLGLLTHPFGLIQVALFLGVYGGLFLVDNLRGRGEALWGPDSRVMSKLLYGGVAGALIGGGWLIPFLTRPQWTEDQGHILLGAEGILEGVITGTFLGNGWPTIAFLSYGGLALAMVRGGVGPRFLGLTGALALVLSSITCARLLMSIHPLFGRVQWERLLIAAKPCIYVMAGYGLMALFKLLWDVAKGGRGGRMILPGRVALGGLGLLVASMLAADVAAAHRRLLELPLSGESEAWKDAEALRQWESSLNLDEEGFFRVLLLLDAHDHTLMATPGFTKIPHFKVGYTPARTFRHNPELAYPPMLTLLGVKYIVTRQPEEGPHIEALTTLRGLYIYRYKSYQPRRFSLKGDGEVTLTHFDPEHIAFDIQDAAPGASLMLHVANYLRWEATLNGQVIPITEAEIPTPEMRPILMEVPITQGRLEFRYVRRWADSASLVSLALGLLMALLAPLLPEALMKGPSL